ncbi:hypothetical protein [Streptomyces avidinii]
MLLSAFFLVGVWAATGTAWDPLGGASVEGASAPGGLPAGSGPDAAPGASGAATASPTPPPAPTKGAAAKGNPKGAVDSGAERPTGALPFDMPQPAALRSGAAGKKLVFAHYFTPYPLSLDNAAADRDYYTRNYLDPDGESGKHGRYGGLLRDRPLPVTPKGGDWEYANLQQEVRTARAAGIDGFTLAPALPLRQELGPLQPADGSGPFRGPGGQDHADAGHDLAEDRRPRGARRSARHARRRLGRAPAPRRPRFASSPPSRRRRRAGLADRGHRPRRAPAARHPGAAPSAPLFLHFGADGGGGSLRRTATAHPRMGQ